MLSDIEKVRKIRKQLGLTQTELAEEASVSQSLIAKIENGTAVPSYKNGKRILDTLEKLMTSEESALKAEDVHTSSLLYLDPSESVGNALEIMREKAISQLPVLKDGLPIGCVTEKCLLRNFEKIDRKEKVKNIMEEPFPLIDVNTDIELVKEILRYYPSVLTSKNGKVNGIITKADLIKEI